MNSQHTTGKKDSFEELVAALSEEINGILRTNLYETGLSLSELERLRGRKSDLRNALKNCGIGDLRSKEYIKKVIKNILISKLLPKPEMYEQYISFSRQDRLTSRDKFDIILFLLKKKYSEKAFSVFMEEYDSFSEQNADKDQFCIDEDYINRVYELSDVYLSTEEKLEILTQRVYSAYKGLGVIDDIRDMKIDGVSGGVSGREGQFNNVWVFYRGRSIHLSFLSFENERELERVCMNIYRYGTPGQLSKSKGYIVNEMKDHSRVVVVRPPFSESFAFFVRKFDNIESKKITSLINDRGSEIPIDIIKYIVKGCQVSAITGAQGSGKTTLLMSIIDFIPKEFSLRIQEMAFELHLREIYPDRNILTFRETEYISGQEGLDIQKKTDGVVNILGEIASMEVAAWMIQMSQVGSLFTLFTHHGKTTDSLIKYMRNALLTGGNFSNENVALQQVIEAIRFDIHMEKDFYGHRYIERISEIVKDGDLYYINNIVEYCNGEYIFKNRISEETSGDMEKHLSYEDRKEFYERFGIQNQQKVFPDGRYYRQNPGENSADVSNG